MCESVIEQLEYDRDHESQTAERCLVEVFRTLTYKPGYKFTWEHCDDGRIVLILVTSLLLDAVERKQGIFVKRRQYLDPATCLTLQGVREGVLLLIQGWEVHDMFEWLKFDSQRVKDPHEDELDIAF